MLLCNIVLRPLTSTLERGQNSKTTLIAAVSCHTGEAFAALRPIGGCVPPESKIKPYPGFHRSACGIKSVHFSKITVERFLTSPKTAILLIHNSVFCIKIYERVCIKRHIFSGESICGVKIEIGSSPLYSPFIRSLRFSSACIPARNPMLCAGRRIRLSSVISPPSPCVVISPSR